MYTLSIHDLNPVDMQPVYQLIPFEILGNTKNSTVTIQIPKIKQLQS